MQVNGFGAFGLILLAFASSATADAPLADAAERADRAAVRSLVESLRPALDEFGDYDEVRSLAEDTLARGNSSHRQRTTFAGTQQLDDVVRLVVAETQSIGERS